MPRILIDISDFPGSVDGHSIVQWDIFCLYSLVVGFFFCFIYIFLKLRATIRDLSLLVFRVLFLALEVNKNLLRKEKSEV